MTRLGLIALLCAAPLCAQSIDRAASGFLTDSQGRPDTCAPYRLQFEGPQGSTATIEIVWQNVVLSREVAVAQSPAQVIIPLPVATDAVVSVLVNDTKDSFVPGPPSRLASASYNQPYAAIIAGGPTQARTFIPAESGVLAADYYGIADFFTDWRLFDGYDAIILLNPDEDRLPPGAQRAIADFCSLGGVVFVAGNFRFGDQSGSVPAPGQPQVLSLAGTALQRFGYGAGAIYRCDYDVLRNATSAHQVVLGALRNHLWYGATEPPAGPALTRAAPADRPWLVRGPRAQGHPGPLFWVLACALLAITATAPVLAGRISPRAWVGGTATAVLAASVSGMALMQGGPLPVADAWPIFTKGEFSGGPASLRSFVLTDAGMYWHMDLADEEQRWLPRPSGDGWVVDLPLCTEPEVSSRPAELASGRVDGINFRDFVIAARSGELHYSPESGAVVDWWLENNAWRGRDAGIASGTTRQQPFPPGTTLRARQGIVVIPGRADSK